MTVMGETSFTTLLNPKGIRPRILWFCGSMVDQDAPALMVLYMSTVHIYRNDAGYVVFI